ncbi:MAG: bifunctional diguanylate cyclase/phosphodiesterase [Candidatus Baltobacteraceae bacterium]|jgi:diguanylate cyclase (GGDEF)-like protein/PAS domain S-box-containing protein
MPLVACVIATACDALVTLLYPPFQPYSNFVTLVVSIGDTVLLAFCYGSFAGIGAGIGATAFDMLLRVDPSLSYVPASTARLELILLTIEVLTGFLIGRLQELSLRVQKQTDRLEQRERRFRALTENAADLVLVVDQEGQATYASQSHEAVLGVPPKDLLGEGFRLYLDEKGKEAVARVVEHALENPAASESFEMTMRCANNSPRILEVLTKNCLAEEAVGGVVFSARDVTERRDIEAQLAAAALHDALTGLPNRERLRIVLDQQLSAALTSGAPLALLIVDLDRFRDVNDVLGHHYGDALLVDAGKRLCAEVGAGDTVARVGGDEFALVLPRRDVKEATVMAERVALALRNAYSIAGQTVIIGATVGIAVARGGIDTATILRQADVALESARHSADGISIYTIADDERARRRLSVGSAFHAAIACDELVLYYQPQLSIVTGRVHGVEALIRWEHPQRGLLRPDQFLPTVEEIGMMGRLTDWVLRNALRQQRRWRQKGLDLHMAVNLSAQNLRDSTLPETVSRLLSLYEIPPSRLCLELTETTVAVESERATQVLNQLSALGCRISIDDFGTGYSSLLHLKRFPFDELKIDRTFVANLMTDPEDAAIVSSTIELARRLDMDVVVEGIEETETLDAIAQLGAQYAQGYLLSVPLTAVALERWLLARQTSPEPLAANTA